MGTKKRKISLKNISLVIESPTANKPVERGIRDIHKQVNNYLLSMTYLLIYGRPVLRAPPQSEDT